MAGTRLLSFVDLSDVMSPQPLKYICCGNEFMADGVELRRLGDVHLFDGERDGRPFVRAFFTSGLTFKKFVINFDASFKVPTELTATGGRYAFRWFYWNWASTSAAE